MAKMLKRLNIMADRPAPTIKDVAERAELSVVTVSRVLNGYQSVREENRRRVLDAVAELGYAPSAPARSLARGRTGTLGVVVPTLGDPFFAAVVEEAAKAALTREYHTSLCVTEASVANEESYVRLLAEGRVDGLLIITSRFERKYILELKGKGLPFVLLDHHHLGVPVASVTVDNFHGGYLATNHLLQLGHTRIGHLAGPPESAASQERLRGYRVALAEAGVAYDPDLVRAGDFSCDSGRSLTLAWLSQGKLPTALFAGDDNIAFGAISALLAKGLSIPGDYSVIGYDDHPLAEMLHPALTTIRQPLAEMARQGIDLLLGLLAREEIDTPIVLTPVLIKRDSCCPPDKGRDEAGSGQA